MSYDPRYDQKEYSPDQKAIAEAEAKGLKQSDTAREKPLPAIWDKVKRCNDLLKDGEPHNISQDPYTKYQGYSPQYIVDALNEVFGFDRWGFTEYKNELTDLNEHKKPTIALAKVGVWIEEKYTEKIAWGQSRVTRGDYGDARKGAQTDAIKKALSYFSIGNRAYRGELKNVT